MTCECDYDCVGDPPYYLRSNRSTLCPAHDDCERCENKLAVAARDGEKLCQACIDEYEHE